MLPALKIHDKGQLLKTKTRPKKKPIQLLYFSHYKLSRKRDQVSETDQHTVKSCCNLRFTLLLLKGHLFSAVKIN
jgi:hypothetical protein